MPLSFHLEWSQPFGPGPCGLTLARELGWTCAWDAKHWIHLLNHDGQRQGQVHFPQPLAQVALADDGSCIIAAGQQGLLRSLAPDLSTLWEITLGGPLLSVAVDSLGQTMAVADGKGGLLLLDRLGKKIASGQSPRALHHLTFVPNAREVLGAADFGLLAAFDHSAQLLWRDTPVVHVGGLAVNATGDKILLACFSEGIGWYDRGGKLQRNLPTAQPCRLVCQSFTGDFILAAAFSNLTMLLSGEGQMLAKHPLATPIHALAFGPLGQDFVAALSDGAIVKYRIEGLPPKP